MSQYHRRSIRLPGYDYTQPGAYFVTMLTHDRVPLFGQIVGEEMRLNEFGQIANDTWTWLACQYSYISLYTWIVMPDHTHGIIQINELDNPSKGESRLALTGKTKPLGQLIGAYKTVSAKRINQMRNTPGFLVWHRNYYEHIISDQGELQAVYEYIQANPARWQSNSGGYAINFCKGGS